MKQFLTLSVLVFTLIVNTNAQLSSRTIFPFLDIPSGARVSALGGYANALATASPEMLVNNAAYLTLVPSNTYSISYLNHLADINYSSAYSSFSLPTSGNIGVGVRYMGYGDLQRIDNRGEVLEDISAYDAALSVTYADTIGGLRYGITFDAIRSRYDEVSSTALAFSMGVLYINQAQDFTLGFSAHNVGGQVSNFTSNDYSIFDPNNEPLPLDIRLGVSQKLQYLPLRIMATFHSLQQFQMPISTQIEEPNFTQNLFRHVVMSGEFLFSESFNFRLGYDHYRHEQLKSDEQFDLSGVSFGFGLIIKDISIDFARNSWSDIGARTQLTLRRTF